MQMKSSSGRDCIGYANSSLTTAIAASSPIRLYPMERGSHDLKGSAVAEQGEQTLLKVASPFTIGMQRNKIPIPVHEEQSASSHHSFVI
ncbi:hypothetical protein TNCV_2606421 [Trichonephila clavipes]|nr:hypothetical protein TNCV_2606421 [Trichonephila clavipes]